MAYNLHLYRLLQDMEAHQKMLSAHQAQAMAQSVAQAQSAQLDPKAFLEAQMLDVQRKLGKIVTLSHLCILNNMSSNCCIKTCNDTSF